MTTFKVTCKLCGVHTEFKSERYSETVLKGLAHLWMLIHVCGYHPKEIRFNRFISSCASICIAFLCFLWESLGLLVQYMLLPFYWFYTNLTGRWY